MTTALVTGATQGLGLALVDGLAHRLGPDDRVLLTGRDRDRVAHAVDGLGPTTAPVEGRVLDVTDSAAVQSMADELGGVDIVFSNASARMTPDRSPAEQIDQVVATNNGGCLRILRSMGPILRPGGRLLVVASSFGTLGHLDPRVRDRFDDARSLADIEAVLAQWQAAVHDGTAADQGWPHWLNIPSKVAQVAAVRVVAAQRRAQDRGTGTLVASVCPGLIDTDASRPWFDDMSQAQTPAEAAVALLDLARADQVDPAHYGELVRYGQVLAWRSGATAQARPGGTTQRRAEG